MFIEPAPQKYSELMTTGWIEIICGSMFSGKTEELIRRLNRAKIARLKTQIFKPSFDNRYAVTDIVSHNENVIQSTPVDDAKEILALIEDCDVVGIDEAQFFGQDILLVCNELADSGKRVIVAGLDMDYEGKPFGFMPQLMSMAEYVTKVHAVCMVCGGEASYSYRLSKDKEQVLLGESDKYEARCRRCNNLGEKAVYLYP
jgi:thymidine kinase